MEYRIFSAISDIKDESKKIKFKDFSVLNNFIENWVCRDELMTSYADILCWDLDISYYTELHYQIKYLLEDVKVSCNSILEFYDYKITSYKKLIISFIYNNPFIFLGKDKKLVLDFINYSPKKTHIILSLNWYDDIKLLTTDNDKVLYHKLVAYDKKRRELSRKLHDANLFKALDSYFWKKQ